MDKIVLLGVFFIFYLFLTTHNINKRERVLLKKESMNTTGAMKPAECNAQFSAFFDEMRIEMQSLKVEIRNLHTESSSSHQDIYNGYKELVGYIGDEFTSVNQSIYDVIKDTSTSFVYTHSYPMGIENDLLQNEGDWSNIIQMKDFLSRNEKTHPIQGEKYANN